ncbi:DUF6346 domain-containing protein [Actinopolyspora saharensis]|uniref:Uncharacterized protein n=1 Tax=Actinopolyspora saharensis TaxID=995062 RepID=A0A1H1EAG5_9ACTN|nr:DUF6346 domain-containing protein [Actinopolyspora saharensis]SDQ85735.1 hypothetical protein SAMN04489718_2451 [Actinopolyspora saharensis]
MGFLRVVRDVLLVPLGLVLFLSGILVVLPFFGVSAAGAEVTDRGTAVAQRCRFAGPIADSQAPERENVLGFGHICQARVTWRDGTTELREVSGSQLTPDDIGTEVAVVERAVDDSARGSSTRSQVFRAGYEANMWLGVPVLLVVCGLGLGCVVFGVGDLRRRAKAGASGGA